MMQMSTVSTRANIARSILRGYFCSQLTFVILTQVFRRNNYDRHLIEVGCFTFTQLFSNYPMLDYLAKYDTLEVEGVCIGEALRSHAEAIGSVVTDIQENAGNPERIRMSLAQV